MAVDWNIKHISIKSLLLLGKGKMVSKSHLTLYEGDFEDNLPNGFGVFARAFPKNRKHYIRTYRGVSKAGERSTTGSYHDKNGTYYVGNWKDGKQENYGLEWYADGSFYAGEFLKGVCHGSGMFVRTDGNRYEGEWKDGMKHGKGIFYHLNKGQMQKGLWEKDMCIFSTISVIPFRQCALFPSQYPVPEVKEKIHLLDCMNLKFSVLQTYVASSTFKEYEAKILRGEANSCLSLSDSSTIEENEEN